MGNEEYPPDALSGTTLDGAVAPGGRATAVAGADTEPSAGSGPGPLTRVRAALAGMRSRRALGWVLLVAWAAWLVAVWVTQPRLVPQEFLADELAQGNLTGYRLVTVDEDGGRGGFSGPHRLDLYPVADEDLAESLDGTYSGSPVSVAYWVDAPVARLRVVDPNGLSSEVPAALVEQLTAAGVPEAAPSELWFHPSQRVNNLGVLLLFASLVVVILGPRPRRGTRWFWFWLLGGLVSVGIAIFAVAELVRPRYEPEGTVHPPGVAGRWSGLAGFALGFVLSIAGALLLTALADLSPIWFLRG
jgi:hypothetical protein